MTTGKTIHIDAGAPSDGTIRVLKALGNEARIDILRQLGDRVASVGQLASELGPVSYTHLTLPTTPYV